MWSDYLPLEEALTLHNVIILIKLIFNKDQNNYYYKLFLEKYLQQLAEKEMITNTICKLS